MPVERSGAITVTNNGTLNRWRWSPDASPRPASCIADWRTTPTVLAVFFTNSGGNCHSGIAIDANRVCCLPTVDACALRAHQPKWNRQWSGSSAQTGRDHRNCWFFSANATVNGVNSIAPGRAASVADVPPSTTPVRTAGSVNELNVLERSEPAVCLGGLLWPGWWSGPNFDSIR
jgi:hypothetical protein